MVLSQPKAYFQDILPLTAAQQQRVCALKYKICHLRGSTPAEVTNLYINISFLIYCQYVTLKLTHRY